MEKQELETKFGKVWLTATDANHIFVSAANGQYGETPIKVFSVDYHLAGHLHKWSDGTFKFGKEDSRESQFHEPYMSRACDPNLNVSFPAKRVVRNVLPELVTEWVKKNPAVLAEAELENLKDKWGKKQEEMNELLKKVKVVNAEIAHLAMEIEKAEKKLYDMGVRGSLKLA